MRIGVVSDTHGRIDDRVRRALGGVDHIIHAGDVGGGGVLVELAAIAPLAAVVRGNTDAYPGADALPLEATVTFGETRVLVGHIREALLRAHDPAREGIDVVVTGHTHRAAVVWDGGVLYLNPGSAGRPRFGMPRTLALLGMDDEGLRPEIVALD
jgi:uncharacterized protein